MDEIVVLEPASTERIYSGPALMTTAENNGHVTTDATMSIRIDPGSTVVDFGATGPPQVDLLGSLFEGGTEIPMNTDPEFIRASPGFGQSTASGEVFRDMRNSLASFVDNFLNDPDFLDSLPDQVISAPGLRYECGGHDGSQVNLIGDSQWAG